MSSAKLKIDLVHGIIDVEGSEEFVSTIYKDFKSKLDSLEAHALAKPPVSETRKQLPGQPDKGLAKTNTNQTKSKKSSKVTQTIVKDLDLSGAGKCERLKDFYAQYDAKTNMERNLIFVYYLEHKLKMTGIKADHVFSCYRDTGVKVPGALRQSLIDTAARHGWLDTSDTDEIKVAIPGVNHLEHDMPRKATNA